MMTDFNDPGWNDDDAMLDDDLLLDSVLHRADAAVLDAVKAAVRDDGLVAILRIPQPETPSGQTRQRRRPPRSTASTAPEQPARSAR